MFLLNVPGLIGVVLAVVLGYRLANVLPASSPGVEELAIHAGALFLGLYGLTFDRCEVPGLVASYRANLQNIFAAASEAGLGTYDKAVVPGRRLAVFFLPVAIAPVLSFLLALGDVALRLGTNGTLSRLDRYRFLELPVASLGLWACYALATRPLRLRTRASTHESIHFH